MGGRELAATPRLNPDAERWLSGDLADGFAGRVLGVDALLPDRWGRYLARGRSAGRPMSVMDALVAATARLHGLTLVTRNVADSRSAGISLHDSWN